MVPVTLQRPFGVQRHKPYGEHEARVNSSKLTRVREKDFVPMKGFVPVHMIAFWRNPQINASRTTSHHANEMEER